jgi:hypothetical protein
VHWSTRQKEMTYIREKFLFLQENKFEVFRSSGKTGTRFACIWFNVAIILSSSYAESDQISFVSWRKCRGIPSFVVYSICIEVDENFEHNFIFLDLPGSILVFRASRLAAWTMQPYRQKIFQHSVLSSKMSKILNIYSYTYTGITLVYITWTCG